MKNTRLTKLLAVCLSLVLVIGAVALVAVFAEGSSESAVTDKVGIASVNLSFGDKHQLAYAVRADESYLTETNGRVGLLFWNYNPEADGEKSAEELYRSAQDRVFSDYKETIGDEEFYIISSSGIALDSLASDVYVCPIVKHVEVSHAPGAEGEDTTYSFSYTKGYTRKVGDTLEYAPRAASVMRYALQQLTEMSVDVTDEEYIADADAYLAKLNNKVTMYTKLANLANSTAETAATSRVLGVIGAEYAVKATGALFNSFAAGDDPYNFIDVSALAGVQSYTLRAAAHTAEGCFLGWVDQNGNVVSPARITDISISSAGYIVNGQLSTYDDAVTTISPAYGDAAAANMISYQTGSEALITTGTEKVTQSFKTDVDGNRYVNFKKYSANSQTGETKMAVVEGIADTLEVGKTYAVEFDIRFNDLKNADYTVDENGKYTVTYTGANWWTYFGFCGDVVYKGSDGKDVWFADAKSVANQNTCNEETVSLAGGGTKAIYMAENSLLFKKPFSLDTYGDWVTVRSEIDIIAAEGDDVTSYKIRYYVNGVLLETLANTKKNLQLSQGIEAFYIKWKGMKNADGQITGYDFDIDNATSFVFDTVAN